ncbi:hypothetical protein AOLI_G00081820 [Acnodon oligacanthus]
MLQLDGKRFLHKMPQSFGADRVRHEEEVQTSASLLIKKFKHGIIVNKTRICLHFGLTIKDSAKEDEGNYRLTLVNNAGSVSSSAMVYIELNEWRIVQWEQDPMITPLKNFKIGNDDVRELRILLHGPIGAGKSSIINTIKTIFEGKQFINCLASSVLNGESFTKTYQKFSVGTSPFSFYDVMGLEKDHEKGQTNGARSDDIIKALKGHIANDYEFKQEVSIYEDNRYYIKNPTLNDQIHCLVSVIAADKVSLMDDEVIQKMRTIRAEASKLGIPQLVFMTRVDEACKLTKEDLTKIYKSKKIKENMEKCSNRLGVPMNCIFPLKNYHEENNMNEKLNCLALEAFTLAVHSANDYVTQFSHKQKCVE